MANTHSGQGPSMLSRTLALVDVEKKLAIVLFPSQS
jgi:hypothetical protein